MFTTERLQSLKNIGLDESDLEALLTIVNKTKYGGVRIATMTPQEAMSIGLEPVNLYEEAIQAFAAIVVENSYISTSKMGEEIL